MDLRKIAENLGIEEYPAEMETVTPVDVCDPELIEYIHKTYDIFRDHYEDVIRGAEALRNNPDRYTWAQYASAYIMTLPLEAAKKVPLPMEEGAGDILTLLIQLPMIPQSAKVYAQRGFTEEEIHQLMASYYGCSKAIFNKTGTFGLDLRFHRWMLIYAKSQIFLYMGFNMEILNFPEGAMILKNKETGEVLPLIWDEAIHKSGMILGSAGYEVACGAPFATINEDDEGFYGYCVRNCKCNLQEQFFPKAQWECAIRPGNKVISVHLPKGMDLSVENVDNAFASVTAKAATWFPNDPVKGLYCGSWLLDPALGDLIGENSKIALFGKRFVRWPILSDGQEIFRFVFPGKPEDLNDLPENTRLEKGLKNLYLNDGFIYGYRGVIL